MYADVHQKHIYGYMAIVCKAGNLLPSEQARCGSAGYLGYMPWPSGNSTGEPISRSSFVLSARSSVVFGEGTRCPSVRYGCEEDHLEAYINARYPNLFIVP